MDAEELKAQINQLVGENELKDAITLMLENAIYHADEAVKLLGRLNDLEENQRKGLIKPEDAGIEKNQIRVAIVELKNILGVPPQNASTSKENAPQTNAGAILTELPAQAHSNNFFKYALLIFSSILLLSVLFFLFQGQTYNAIVSGVLVLGLCIVFLQIQNNEFKKERLRLETARMHPPMAA